MNQLNTFKHIVPTAITRAGAISKKYSIIVPPIKIMMANTEIINMNINKKESSLPIIGISESQL